jgi:hypothetical protein
MLPILHDPKHRLDQLHYAGAASSEATRLFLYDNLSWGYLHAAVDRLCCVIAPH